MQTFTFLGTTDTITTCDCCGRTGLNSTVALRNTETGETVYFGSACGARAIGWGVKEFTKAATAATTARELAAARLFNSIYSPVKVAAFEALCAIGGPFSSPEKQAVTAAWAPKLAAAHAAATAAVSAYQQEN